MASLYELWAFTTPAPVVCGTTVDAAICFVRRAYIRSMITSTGATCVSVFSAVLGHMAPALAFEAVYGLLLILDQVEMLHVVVKAFKY